MERHEFLAALHAQLRPRNYLEIGVGTGLSLALSHVPSIGVDPKYQIQTVIPSDILLVRHTSDWFFDRREPLRFLMGGRNPWRNLRHNRPPFNRLLRRRGTLDLAFIDGMHLFEYALRDFMNVERLSAATTVIVLDDMLPRNVTEASRERTTQDWTGDVYKLVAVLRQYRPDLLALTVDTQPTGLLLILGPDRESTVLKEHYDEIVAAHLHDDPQDVPASILARDEALDPEALLASGWCQTVVRGRGLARRSSAVRAALRHDLEPFLGAPGQPAAAASLLS
jgi:hypothetical protein